MTADFVGSAGQGCLHGGDEWAAVNRATLARQLLLERESVRGRRGRAAGGDAGAGAQDIRTSVCGRGSVGFEESELDRAVADREVVRATMFRRHLASGDSRGLSTVSDHGVAGARGGLGGARGIEGPGWSLRKVVAAAKKLLAKEPLTFTEVRDALQKQFPDVNERALGFCTRMLVPSGDVPD